MQRSHPLVFGVALAASLLSLSAFGQEAGRPGERIPATAISPLVLESMDKVLERQRTMPRQEEVRFMWNGQDGRWFVPPDTAKTPTHSGLMAIVNEWGDTRMGIGFPWLVDLTEVWAAGHGGAPARAIRFVGFRGGKEVARTEWIALGPKHQRVVLPFTSVDRVEVQGAPFVGHMGFFALDDLRLAPAGDPAAARVLDFEDLSFRTVLTGTRYAGLAWERGHGFRDPLEDAQIVPAPVSAPVDATDEANDTGRTALGAATATSPRTWEDYVGVTQGDPGATLVPPDTCGATGPDHYVVIVNANLSAFTKTAGTRVLNVSLNAFWNVSGLIGDPRIVFDPHSQRFIALGDTFSGTATLYFAVSQTADPTGSWFKFSFRTDQGSDAGKWPDYPTLGVDARGIYTAAYMVGGSSLMTIWSIDKAPLLTNPPSVGTITAFRSLPFEGSIQPCTTYGDPGVEYFASRRSSTLLRIRHVTPPLTAPTLVETGSATIPSHTAPPIAPALGSTTAINTIDTRLMNAVFRAGSVWSVHGISVGGRAGCRWYEVGTSPVVLRQNGTLSDTLWHYYYASIAADAQGNVGLGFSGSHANAYCSTFVTGRRAGDPAGLTAPAILVKAGEAAWNRLDGSGRNRFGDYSFIDVDPVDDLGFWTNQEYIAPAANTWRTRITRFGFEAAEYGDGLAGTASVPSLDTAARPAIGQNMTLRVGNSGGPNPAAGALIIGVRTASVPVFGGMLLVDPLVVSAVAVPAPRASVVLPVPNDRAIVGSPIYFQSAQLDAGAVQGVALSRGLEVRPSSR